MDNAYQRLGNVNKSIYDYLRKPFKNLICPNVTYTLFGIVSDNSFFRTPPGIYGYRLLYRNRFLPLPLRVKNFLFAPLRLCVVASLR